MSEINITLEGGTSKRLLTAGKFCDKDIVVTAEGGSGGGNEVFSVAFTSTYYQMGTAGTQKRYRPNAECIAYRDGAGQFTAEAFNQIISASDPDDISQIITIKNGDIVAIDLAQSAVPVCTGGVETLGSLANALSGGITWYFAVTGDGTIAVS